MDPIQVASIGEAIKHVKEWIAQKEYDKARQGLTEILEFDPKNEEALELYKSVKPVLEAAPPKIQLEEPAATPTATPLKPSAPPTPQITPPIAAAVLPKIAVPETQLPPKPIVPVTPVPPKPAVPVTPVLPKPPIPVTAVPLAPKPLPTLAAKKPSFAEKIQELSLTAKLLFLGALVAILGTTAYFAYPDIFSAMLGLTPKPQEQVSEEVIRITTPLEELKESVEEIQPTPTEPTVTPKVKRKPAAPKL